MLKHKKIIDGLTLSQKARLISDVSLLTDSEFVSQGLPSVKFADFTKYCEILFISPFALASSYDGELIKKVARAVFCKMGRDGVNCAIVRGPKIKISPFDISYSDDVEACVSTVDAILSAADEVSMRVCLDGFGVSESDTEWLDRIPKMNIVREYIVKPFERVSAHTSCIGIIAEQLSESSPYYSVNEELKRDIITGRMKSFAGKLICRNVRERDTVKAIENGMICLSASESTLKAAADRYVSLKSLIASGRVTVGELMSEEESGRAISPDAIDLAIERLLDFAENCNRTVISAMADSTDEILAECFKKCSVLLKNTREAIPVTNKQTVALIGDIINLADGENYSEIYDKYVSYLEALGFTVNGYSQGYEIGKELSQDKDPVCYELIRKSDKVVVFLGKTKSAEKRIKEHKNLHLDANQAHFVDSIASYKHKIIFVYCGAYSFDASFTKYGAATICIPNSSEGAIKHALGIILGIDNAEGKLSSPVYADTDSFARALEYRSYLGTRTGRFMGYRYADTAGYGDYFPIGSGYTGASFKYSHFRIDDKKISFSVKNTSRLPATDIAQVYVGFEGNALAMPKRELLCFERITLAGGETKHILLDYNYSLLDVDSGEFVFPRGRYSFYLGSSLSDAELVLSVNMGERELKSDKKEDLSDYLESESNILSDKYTLEADCKHMKKGYRNIIFGVGAAFLATVLALLSMIAGISSPFVYVISAILMIAAVVFFVLHGVDNARIEAAERKRINEANAKLFEDAEKIPVVSASVMFVNEFDKLELRVTETQENDEIEDDHFRFVKKDFKFNSLISDFEVFTKDRGYNFDKGVIARLFASLMSSRLVITRMDKESYGTLLTLLCEYFGSPVLTDSVAGIDSEADVLIKDGKETEIMRGLALASRSLQDIFIISLTEVTAKNISDYFVPFAKHIRNPLSDVTIPYVDENGAEKRIAVSNNVFFMMNLESGERAYNIPAYLLEASAILDVEYTRCAPAEAYSEVNGLKYYQLEYMLEKSRSTSCISEDNWKKIDKLAKLSEKKLTNKLTVGFERYVKVYALGTNEADEAFFSALEAKLIPFFAAEMTDAKEIATFSEALDGVFSEENTVRCQRALKENSAN